MQALIDQLQAKIRSYKKQIEEAEEIAALNLAKYRQAQSGLAEAEERADLNEQALAKYKARGRSASLAPQVRMKFEIAIHKSELHRLYK
jgi:myosin heavy chain 6/7